ncbi:ABC transporter ATP-binding protein [Acidobacteria bacterium AH-259-D05]|nr:ABC transporter ATP-binding protein [Acidobacteria bacterium AH-259-D05]
MSSETAVSVRGLSKAYYLYERPVDRLKQALWRGHRQFYTEFWALRDVSFDVPKGSTVGIIGRNGSGKTTLLQIIAGILTPTTGEVTVGGQLAPLLELGAGFNPEFTGRENVFLNGAILGIGQEEMAKCFDEIAAFADIGEFFLNKPVKTYSTGMLMRLAFSVALLLEPDIFIIDEVLSVGDIPFQQKCAWRMKELKSRGKTMILASHDTNAVRNLCDRALVLNSGSVYFDGDSVEAVDKYYSLLHGEAEQRKLQLAQYGRAYDASLEMIKENHVVFKTDGDLVGRYRHGTQEASITAVEVTRMDGSLSHSFEFAEQVCISAYIQFHSDVENATVGFMLQDKYGIDILGFNSQDCGENLGKRARGDKVVVKFTTRLHIRPDEYTLRTTIRYPLETGVDIDVVPQCYVIHILSSGFPVWGIAYTPTEFKAFLVDTST